MTAASPIPATIPSTEPHRLMQVVYTCHDAVPSSNTNTQQIFWTLFELSQLGVGVELVVPSINGSSGDATAALARHYGADPTLVPRTFTVSPQVQRATVSSLAKGWFDLGLPRRLAGKDADLVWTRDPVAAMVLSASGRPTMFETYRPDLASATAFAWWRRRCLGRLRGVIVHSQIAAAAFVKAGVPRERCLVAHNGFAPALMRPVLDRATARAHLGLEGDRPLVVYAGHVGRKKGIDALIDVAAAVPDALFLLVGADPVTDEGVVIEKAARRGGAYNVRVLPRVRVADVASYLYAADVLAIPPTEEPLRRFQRTVLPMKLFSYMAAGRPILAPRTPDVEEVLRDGVTARLVPSGDRTAAARALESLLSDATLRQALSRGASAAAERFTWANRAARIAPFLRARLDEA